MTEYLGDQSGILIVKMVAGNSNLQHYLGFAGCVKPSLRLFFSDRRCPFICQDSTSRAQELGGTKLADQFFR